jgi:two-component system sensor histidine kinase UhpB
LAMVSYSQSLDRRGIPLGHALIAMSLYLECCCAVFLSRKIHDSELTIALAHLNSVGQSLVIVGYSKQYSKNWLKLVETERRRFSQDLHDEIGHNLIVLKLYLELMARDYKKGNKKDVIEKMEEAMTLVSHSINSVRRLIQDLGPAVLDQLALLPSFRLYAKQFLTRTGIKVEIRGKDILEMPKIYETVLFRVFQGALSNVAKHSKAKKVQVTARLLKGSIIQMIIEDNGVGFVTTDRHAREMFGLTAMQERIERLGGQFRLKSRQASAKDSHSGTKIEVTLPTSDSDFEPGKAKQSNQMTGLTTGVAA